MSKDEWDKIDRTRTVGEPYWNQFNLLLEIREDVYKILKEV